MSGSFLFAAFQAKCEGEKYFHLLYMFKNGRIRKIGHELSFSFVSTRKHYLQTLLNSSRGAFEISRIVKMNDRRPGRLLAAKVFVQSACNSIMFAAIFPFCRDLHPIKTPDKGQ
jgi:hypothetical protein